MRANNHKPTQDLNAVLNSSMQSNRDDTSALFQAAQLHDTADCRSHDSSKPLRVELPSYCAKSQAGDCLCYMVGSENIFLLRPFLATSADDGASEPANGKVLFELAGILETKDVSD
jgi:hypothetical protein